MYTAVSGTAAVGKGKNHWIGSALKGPSLDNTTVSYTELEAKKATAQRSKTIHRFNYFCNFIKSHFICFESNNLHRSRPSSVHFENQVHAIFCFTKG
jgi:hypothetical protein